MRVMTPIAISRRSAGVSGHGYRVARNLKETFLQNMVTHVCK